MVDADAPLRQLLDFSLAEVRGGIRAVDLLRELADDDSAGSVDKLRKLFEVLGHHLAARSSRAAAWRETGSVIAVGRPLELRPDEKCSLDRGRQLDQFPGRCATCSVKFFRSWRIYPSDRTDG